MDHFLIIYAPWLVMLLGVATVFVWVIRSKWDQE